MSLNLTTDCDGCDEKFLVPHALACPKVVLVMAWKNDTTKERGTLSARSINPFCVSYEPNINNTAIQGKSNRAGVWILTVDQGDQEGQGGQGTMGQATVTDESRADVLAHGFGKWVTSALFDMLIVNLDVGS